MPPRAEHKAAESRASTFAFTAVALFLVLVSPLVVFLERHDYSLLTPEVAFCFGVAAALALVVAGMARRPALRVIAISFAVGLAVDAQFDQLGARHNVAAIALVAGAGWILREHLARIVVVVGLAFVISTIVIGRTPRSTQPLLAGGNDQRPFVLHLVLDEHVGLAGLPRGAKYDAAVMRLNAFFERHGFRRFFDAYSEYFWTRYSLSQVLNFSNGRYTPGLFRIGRDARYELVENKYFARVAEQGYSVNVFQTTYLDVCPDPRAVAQCESYDFAGVRELQYSRLDWDDRLFAVGAAYLRGLSIYDRLQRVVRSVTNEADHQLVPRWIANSIRALPAFFSKRLPEQYGSIATRVLTERLVAALSGARRGQYVFAHLMLPHYPYVFLPDCSFRPPSEWNARRDPDAPSPASNTPQGREARYVQYLDQLECGYKDLDRLIDGIPQELRHDAVVILHGDHGSRININEPDENNALALTSADLRDAYSTLLAIKSSTIPAGEERGRVAVGCVLTAIVESGFTGGSPDPLCNAEHTVFKVPSHAGVIPTKVEAATFAP